MSDYLCDACGGPTVYQSFSGGKEYYCPGCGNQASYDLEKEGLPRATLLQTEWGQRVLRAEMDAVLETKVAAQNREIEGLKEEVDAHSGPECMATSMALEQAEAEIDRLRKWEERHKDCSAAERLLDEYQAEALRVLAILHDTEDMLSYLDLHIGRYPITQLTTEQKNLYAELVDAGSLRSWEEDAATDPEDPEDQPRTMDRWWE